MRVSVVIPARNAAATLGDALDSVYAQGLDRPEVVVVDDGSTDGTGDLVRRYGRGVRLLSQPPGGSGRARNLGIEQTQGELIAFLDADDLWVPEKSALQIPLLEAEPSSGLVFSDMVAFGEGSGSYFEERGYDRRCAPSSVFLYDMISTPTVILRRACLGRTGIFDPALPLGQDTDLWFRMTLAFPFGLVDRPLVRRRLHGGNTTRNSRLLARCVVEVWERYLDPCIAAEPHMEAILRAALARSRWHHLFLEGCALLREGRGGEGRAHLARAIRQAPLRLRAYPFYLASFLKGTRP